MCKVLISTSTQMAVKGYWPGDVILALPDDHVFSALELAEAKWQVVSLPGLSIRALSAFGVNGAGNARRRIAVNMGGAVAQLLTGGAPAVVLSGLQTVALLATTVER